jgi:glucokinase
VNGGLLLGADLGGTKTLLAVARAGAGRPAIVHERRYESGAFDSFAAVLARFLADAGLVGDRVEAACVGVAGPIEGRRVKVTNLPWTLDADALSRLLGGAPVSLLNDFAAAAHGVDALEPGALVSLQDGEPVEHGAQLVLGAGTGLGVAFRVWTGERYQVVAGEGGHFGFAPADARQSALAERLRARYGRVIVEHVVSGPGLARIDAFLRGRDSDPVSEGGDPAAIARAALSGADPVALEAVDLFIACYGAVAGDFALACLARGGVFVAGGIAPRLLDRLRAGGFARAFADKGVHAALAARIPVRVVTDDRLGLLGALAAARRPA